MGSPEEQIQKKWLHDAYHAPSDDVAQPVDKQAAGAFDVLVAKLLERIANREERPHWKDSSFFKRFAQKHDGRRARTLSYYTAHEIMHTLLARRLGIVKHWRLPAWKNGGYADLVAKGGDLDYKQRREQLRRGVREFDPKRSGLYLWYHLLVAYLLDHEGMSVDDLLNHDFDPARLEAEILAG